MTSAEPICDVSVVIPVYNPGVLLAEQLEALVRQEGFEGRWEVLLADNGCTDGSLAIVSAFRDRLDVSLVDAARRSGPAFARNAGAAEATGDWLAFCDSDDVVAPDWLSGLWRARDQADLVAGACDVVTLNDHALLKSRGGREYGQTLPAGPCSFLPYAPSCNLLVRRPAFEALAGWDEDLPFCEDVDFSWRAQLRGMTLAFAPDAVVHYRFRGSLRAAFTQMRRYKSAEVQLYVRYRHAGAARSGPREFLGRIWWLASRSPYVVLDRERRTLWWSIAGAMVGRAQGSWRNRVLYL